MTQRPVRLFSRPILLALALSAAAPTALWAATASLPEMLPAGSPNTPVESLDLERYLGTWHEVARLPMFFQRKCVADTTARYALRDDSRITVTNRCRTADKDFIESQGLARTTTNAGALEVTFVPSMLTWLPGVWADYWVIDLDPNYRWAVVGGPSQGALWVLSREATMDEALLMRIKQRAEARGYSLTEWIVAPTPSASEP